MTKIAYDMKLGDISLKTNNLNFMAVWLDEQHVQFGQSAILVHRKTVLEILIRLILLTNVDTGRARGSWLPFLAKYGVDGAARANMQDESLAPSDRKSPKKGLSQEAVEKGFAEGSFIDDALETTIASNVNYMQQLERRTGFISKLLSWARTYYNQQFEEFFAAAAKQGMIPPDDDSIYKPDPNKVK